MGQRGTSEREFGSSLYSEVLGVEHILSKTLIDLMIIPLANASVCVTITFASM